MSEAMIVQIGRQTLEVALMAAIPMLLASMVVGILVNIVQVATSMSDATMAFVPKVLAVAVALIISGHWISHLLLDFTRQIFALLAKVP